MSKSLDSDVSTDPILGGVPYGCARLPILISGGSTDRIQPLLLSCHQFPPFMCIKTPAGFVTLSLLTDEAQEWVKTSESSVFDIVLWFLASGVSDHYNSRTCGDSRMPLIYLRNMRGGDWCYIIIITRRKHWTFNMQRLIKCIINLQLLSSVNS